MIEVWLNLPYSKGTEPFKQPHYQAFLKNIKERYPETLDVVAMVDFLVENDANGITKDEYLENSFTQAQRREITWCDDQELFCIFVEDDYMLALLGEWINGQIYRYPEISDVDFKHQWICLAVRYG